jgi:hypothetical protein
VNNDKKLRPFRRIEGRMPDLSDVMLSKHVDWCEQRGAENIGMFDWSLYWIGREILALRKKVTKLEKKATKR